LTSEKNVGDGPEGRPAILTLAAAWSPARPFFHTPILLMECWWPVLVPTWAKWIGISFT